MINNFSDNNDNVIKFSEIKNLRLIAKDFNPIGCIGKRIRLPLERR